MNSHFVLIAFRRLLLVGVAGASLCAQPASDETEWERDVRLAVEATLAIDDTAGGIRLMDAAIAGERLTLNFSAELLAMEPGSRAFERFSRRIHVAAGDVLRSRLAAFEVFTLIAGVPLHQLLGVSDAAAVNRQRALPEPRTTPGVAALSARRIAVSPGHGYYLNGNNYVLQRAYWNGIVEDFINHDIVTHLATALTAAGADVRPTRNLDRSAGFGETGFPRWQEAARYHVKALGADASVWNESGFTHLEQDIRCRPRYANTVNAEVMVSIHNNGAGTPGAGTGTETLYDTNNGFGPESRRLADILHAKVITAIRRDYNPAWVDRRVQGFNGDYGENRLATRPAVLMEIAFMDRPTPDNAALQDDAFKRLVANAIRDGLREYFDGPIPTAATALSATPGVGTVVLAWRDNADNETGYRVERRTGATGAWSTVVSLGVNSMSYSDTGVTAGTTFEYRVVAFNGFGDAAQFSNVAAAAPIAPATSGPAAWLSNVSLRTSLAANQSVIVGLAVSGGVKDVLIRAAGPALVPLGVTGAMADPQLELFFGATRVGENNDWPAGLAPAVATVGAFSFISGSRDAALRQTLGGAYTVQVQGPAAGAVLIEAYDAGGGSAARLVNLSSRHRVGTGSETLIAGFYVAGTGPKRLLIRAVGPGLAVFGVTGVLADPQLEIFDAGGVRQAENDNWAAGLAATFAQVAAFPLTSGSRDAAVAVTLSAGSGYTAHVAGAGGGTGEALVEIYELP